VKAVFLHVRQGFEADASEELSDQLQNLGVTVREVIAPPQSGYVSISLPNDDWQRARHHLKLSSLIFARQLLWSVDEINLPSEGDRVTDIVSMIKNELLPASGFNAFSGFNFETPDTDSAKELTGFCKSLSRPIDSALNKLRLLPKGKGAAHLPRLVLVMLDPNHVRLTLADIGNSSSWPMGIPRLKFPPKAPSRSTLKLEEAFLVFIGSENLGTALQRGMSAVDLGACPGGWTYQLVKHGLQTTAVDNGAIDQSLLATGLVLHQEEDAFKFRPHQTVDWLVCDVVEQPSRITNLMADWFTHGYCRNAIFNLKLPMKRRYQETSLCLDGLKRRLAAAGLEIELAAKQLYHDRKEVTVCCRLKKT
jgi:23S rRNA (cytidine2498-2'-O)-methyltransferase